LIRLYEKANDYLRRSTSFAWNPGRPSPRSPDMALAMNQLVTPRKLKIALLTVLLFAAMC
jgi:hypothetical protein